MTDATSDGTYLYLSQARIVGEIKTNVDWAKAHLGSTFDPTVLVTGEHSGLATLPQQPNDNPNLAAALTSQGIVVTGSDASRESGPRVVGSASTLPRHPMNIFYNAGTYQDEVSEYNWIYTSAADGGSGICSANPATSTCITPLAASDDTVAKQSFESHILPTETRIALRYVLGGDSRPFYAHQSNLTEDRILYPVVQGVLNGYAAIYDTSKSPLVTSTTADMKELEHALHRAEASATATAYVDATGVHVSAPAGTQVPLTVPASATGTTGLSAYDSGLSGWITATGSDAVVAGLNPAGGGYKVAGPAAPTAVTAVPGITNATVTWTPAQLGLADVTGWTITATTGTPAVSTPVTVTPAQVTSDTAKGTLSFVVTGLTAGASYTFDVRGTNAIATGLPSAPSAAVTILGLPPVPTAVTATAGDASATVSWTAGAAVTGHPTTTFQVTATTGTTSTPVGGTANGTTTTLKVSGLTNGSAYTFTVVAVNDLGSSAPSAPSTRGHPDGARRRAASVPGRGPAPAPGPGAVAPAAPVLGSVTPGNGRLSMAWSAPAKNGGSPVTGYAVRVFRGTGTTPAADPERAGDADHPHGHGPGQRHRLPSRRRGGQRGGHGRAVRPVGQRHAADGPRPGDRRDGQAWQGLAHGELEGAGQRRQRDHAVRDQRLRRSRDEGREGGHGQGRLPGRHRDRSAERHRLHGGRAGRERRRDRSRLGTVGGRRPGDHARRTEGDHGQGRRARRTGDGHARLAGSGVRRRCVDHGLPRRRGPALDPRHRRRPRGRHGPVGIRAVAGAPAPRGHLPVHRAGRERCRSRLAVSGVRSGQAR